MAATTITRSSFIDGTTVWNSAQINSAVYDKIDQLFAGGAGYTTVEFGGSVRVIGGIRGATLTLDNVTYTTAALTATMTNSPKAGNPTGWWSLSINGVTGYIPVWTV